MKLTVKNSWEHRTFFYGEEELTPENCAEVRLAEADKTSTDRISVIWREETKTYSDHGHTSYATSMVPYVMLPVLTEQIQIPLAQLDVYDFYPPRSHSEPWVDTDEGYPPTGDTVLALQSGTYMVLAYREQNDQLLWRNFNTGEVLRNITHWAPVPEL